MSKLITGLLFVLALVSCSRLAPREQPTAEITQGAPPVATEETTNPNNLPLVGFADLTPSGAAPCLIFANLVDALIYANPDDTQPAVARLGAETALVTYQYDANGWYAVNFTVGDVQSVGWLREDAVRLLGSCEYLYIPDVCSVQPNVGRVIDVYAEPSRDSQIIGALGDQFTAPFVGFSDDGWFAIDIGDGARGWIAPDEGVLVGPCDGGS